MNEAVIALEQSKIKTVSFYRITKRSFDIMCAVIGLIFLIPIIVIIKLITLLSGDTKSIFFTQKRFGQNGKIFKLYKFRSMVPNADEVLEKLLKEDKKAAQEYKKNKKLKNDPRITKVGKIIRKASIDELPQLLNVLKGDMSMIGNRPYLPREKEDMGEYYNDVLSTKPGLTGYWQVSGRSDTTFKKRLELEKYYSEHAGIKMDLRIFFKTFSVVLGCKGSE